MRKVLSRLCPVISVIAALWLAGCAGSPQARFYTLSPLAAQEAKPASPATRPVSVSIATVEIPDYLKRPQIVTRDGRNELKLAEFDRWGGSLAENIAMVTAENLSLLLATERVYAPPQGRTEKPDYSLSMRVLSLDCIPGDKVIMKVQWTLSGGPEGKEIATHMSTISEKLKDSRYATAVAAVSTALEQVSREIAREIAAKPALRQ